jgi:hypothetical protein
MSPLDLQVLSIKGLLEIAFLISLGRAPANPGEIVRTDLNDQVQIDKDHIGDKARLFSEIQHIIRKRKV